MSLEPLNDNSWTPAYVLADTLGQADQIENVVILVRYKDGTLDSVLSHQKVGDLSLHCVNLQRRVIEQLQSMKEPR